MLLTQAAIILERPIESNNARMVHLAQCITLNHDILDFVILDNMRLVELLDSILLAGLFVVANKYLSKKVEYHNTRGADDDDNISYRRVTALS